MNNFTYTQIIDKYQFVNRSIKFIFLIIFFSNNTFTQEIVIGTVTDKSGITIEMVKIQVKSTSISTETDSYGNYSIELPKEQRILLFTKVGYSLQEIVVKSGRVDVVMQKEYDILELSLEDLMNVTISTVTKTDEKIIEVPATVEIITYNEIVNRGYTNLEEVLHDFGGFNFSKAHGINTSTIYQRGYRANNTDRTILLIDGVPENDIWKGVAWLDKQYALSNIKQIEIVYGPASALYGANAFQGVINVITKNGGDNNKLVSFSTGYGSYNSFITELMVGKKSNNFDFNFTLRKYDSEENDLKKYDDWNYVVPSSQNFVFPKKEYTNNKNDISFHWKTKYKKISFGGIWWNRDDDSGMTYVDAYKSGSKYASISDNPWVVMNMHTYLMYETDLIKKLHSRTRFTYLRHQHRPESNALYISYTDSFSVDFYYELSQRGMLEQQFDYQNNFGNFKNNFIVGVQYKLANIQGDYLRKRISYPIGGPFPDVPKVSDFGENDVYLTRDLGIYIQDVIKPFNNLSITLGSRLDYNKIREDGGFGWVFSPRLGLVYFLIPKLSVKLLYGEGFSPTDNWTLYSTTDVRMANPTLLPEIVKSKEINTGYQITKFLFVETALYYNSYKNRNSTVIYEEGVLDASNPKIVERNEAVGNWSIWGFESRLKIMIKNLTAYANYSYSNPHDDTKDEAIGNIGQTINFGANYSFLKHFNLNIRNNWVGERNSFTKDKNGDFLTTIPPYFICNSTLLIRDRPFKDLTISITLNNIFNKQYFDPGMRTGTEKYPALLPQNGRNFFLKLTYDI